MQVKRNDGETGYEPVDGKTADGKTGDAKAGDGKTGPGSVAFEIVNGDGVADLVFICDHASNTIPADLDGLGMASGAAGKHVAWDIGAAALTRRMAGRFRVPATLSAVSRLVIDCNRYLDDPAAILTHSDDVEVPGNAHVTPDEAHRRAARFFHPYHDAIDGLLTRLVGLGRVPVLVSVHSCTDMMEGMQRPWHVGVLWNKDYRVAGPLIEVLKRSGDIVVGDNQPYSAALIPCYTTEVHALKRGLPYVILEVRQDLIADEDGVARWAGILGDALAEVLHDRSIYRIVHS